MKRTSFGSGLWLMLALLASSLPVARADDPNAKGSPAQPNVILILADDLGYGDLGCFGQKSIRTPNLDRMAAEGMRFTQAYAGATVCAPSRCSLMTGLHGGHAPIRGNQEIKPEGQLPMPADTLTLAHVLQRAGYRTSLVGKWGLGHPGSVSTPDKMGFDEFFGYNCQRLAHEHYPPSLWRNTEQVPLDGRQYSHDLFTAEAVKFIRDNRSRPFFLDLSYTVPHQKLQVPDLGPYADEPWDPKLKTLAAMIGRLDRDVGTLFALLKELDLDRNTLVLFASDNGAAYQDELFDHSGTLRGRKRDLYEGGIRTPAIVRWPGQVPAGVVSSQVWAFWDLLPTFAELTGQPSPAGVDGISVLSAFRTNEPIEHPPLYFEFHERGFQQAARIGDWKGVRGQARGPIELYDLRTDPAETRNVAAEHPDEVRRMEKFFAEARTESPHWPIREPRGRAAGAKPSAS